MNELVREWVEKAEGDVRTSEREVRATEGPNWDAVCFHAQQAGEKYLKAVLQHQGIPFSRTHDPGESATEEAAQKAVEIMRQLRVRLRQALGFEDTDGKEGAWR